MRLTQTARRALSLLLCAALLISAAPLSSAAGAELAGGLMAIPVRNKVILVEQAQTMALSSSKDISKIYNQILLKKMKYVEAVEGIKAKVKNKTSFRWSPLLNFKFPQPLNMIEEYELNVKPLTLQAEIDTLQHQMNDLRFQVLADVNKAYTQAYISQEKIAFNQEVLDSAKAELERNQARLATGDATQADVDTMTKRVENLTTELSNLKRAFETEKRELSKLVNLDVTSGYTFRNPLKELDLPRELLEDVTEYTLAHDQTFYEAKTSASTALMNLESYESLMRSQYGGKMDIIQGYINMAKQGQEVDYAAFQMKYREFITAIDRPWAFKITILFFTFTMEWFKGEISGSRYIEDEMYAVYTACMEYAAAKTERDAAEETVREQVSASYESLITAWNSYQNLAGLVEGQREDLDKVAALNKLGKATYDEVSDAQTTYEENQVEALDALATYNELLFDFDRLTCGAVTLYMKGESMDIGAGAGGDSIVTVDPIEDPYYYIYTSVANLTFHVGVSIPEDFAPAITDFEVWNEGVQIGERTPVGEEVTHLTIDYGGTSTLLLRFYDGDDFVAEREVDATISRDVLDLEEEEPAAPEERTIGAYKAATTAMGDLSTSELSLDLNASVGAKTYSITYGEEGVYTTEPRDVTESFHYLTLLIASLEEVTLNLYDRDGTLVTTARFDTGAGTIIENSREGGAP